MLAAEVEELLDRGLARHYIALESRLESPRGKILVQELLSRGGISDAKLPCRYFERQANWHLNQVLRAGVVAAAEMTDDRELRQRLYRSVDMFRDVASKAPLETRDIDRAERGLTRLTSASSSALAIIRILHDMRGVAFGPINEHSRTPGFLFDMNVFFQRLLSRFLHENLTARRIEDEISIRGAFAYAVDANPKRRAAPKPRPDFGLFQERNLIGFLDAKYRDSWERGLPSEWLYQGSIYALASPTRVSVLLYATMSEEARDEKIDIQQPIAWSNSIPGSVILRPILMPQLADLLDPNYAKGRIVQRQQWAEDLVILSARKTTSGG
jgi:5-methylcytosine-specific restriction enzyme subunit McrC